MLTEPVNCTVLLPRVTTASKQGGASCAHRSPPHAKRRVRTGYFLDEDAGPEYDYNMEEVVQEPEGLGPPFAKDSADPEGSSVKLLLKHLDKASKAGRTFGAANPVAQKFFQQFFEGLTTHLATYGTFGFLVQRSELYFNDQVVYATETMGENLAFKLYADGIREVTFHPDLTADDVMFFLDSLWAGADPDKDDDDIVTRLWERNLSTITIVTAEEIVKSSGADDIFASPTGETMSGSSDSLKKVAEQEKANESRSGGSSQASRFQSGLVGYETTDEELAALANEIEAESHRDPVMYVLDMLTAILASEKHESLLTKLFEVFGGVVESLIRQGQWTVLESVLALLNETQEVRPDLPESARVLLADIFTSLGRPERIKLVETYLNQTPNANTEGLLTLLLMMPADCVSGLCVLLGNLTAPAHQSIVCEALFALGKDTPDPLVRGLSDRRGGYVRNLLAIIARWNNPRFADAVERILRHPDPQVRKDAVRILGTLRPNGNGTKLVPLCNDSEESVRLAALKLLMSGQYQTTFAAWTPILTAEDFSDRPPSEKRAIFHAVRQAARDEAVPYLQELLTEWSWTNRKKKEEFALLAAETLGKLATPAAVAALEAGQKKAGAAVRQACTAALSVAMRQQKTKQAV